MTPLGLMHMTTLAQSIINLVFQFVRIILKTLTTYLRNRASLFLDNVRVKSSKIIYKNKKLALGIQ